MTTSSATPFEPPTRGLNIVPFASMAGGWLSPLVMFWLYVWGPLRPFSYPPGDLLPHGGFLLMAAGCISVWWLIPAGYFRTRDWERSGELYERLGVLYFRRVAPDGDFANRWERTRDPNYRVIKGRRSAAEFIARTEASEKGHLVMMLLGLVSAVWASVIGWHGWAMYLGLGNVLVNLYPILLQRYTRARINKVLRRGSA